MSDSLPLIWAVLIAVAVFAYVVLDGFDLGVGILFPAVQGHDERDVMVNSVAPVAAPRSSTPRLSSRLRRPWWTQRKSSQASLRRCSSAIFRR
jgi:hypothetical protein